MISIRNLFEEVIAYPIELKVNLISWLTFTYFLRDLIQKPLLLFIQ